MIDDCRHGLQLRRATTAGFHMSANGPRPGMGRAWLGYLAAGAVAIVGYYLISAQGTGVPTRVAVYCLVSGSAALAVLCGVLVHRPRPALPWLLLGASQVVYCAADT